MRMSNPDALLMPLLAPVVILGLWPLVFLLPLTGFLGVAIIGIIIGTGALMAQMEEQADHARQVVGRGFAPAAKQVEYHSELAGLMRSLRTTKRVSAGLIAFGVGGFLLFQ